ncbi:hypothetical protein QVD17_41368 [Tagetes erecta]|uniref:RING-type domain-containing protein n=1 Tax=Tagetes erecta TaxID=13708 RepID=A0AAD8NFJ9_TARER|nr:hypothetical protein QVD17_41368 [Tagetes erecta]
MDQSRVTGRSRVTTIINGSLLSLALLRFIGIRIIPLQFLLILFYILFYQKLFKSITNFVSCFMDAPIEIDGQLANAFPDLYINIEEENVVSICGDVRKTISAADENHHGICAICLKKIALQETALVKGCEHAYCVSCILRWATYKKEPTCPQCKHPFEFLNIHRSLDGSIHDYMFEESVCLLLRASWFHPLHVESHEILDDNVMEDFYPYGYEEVDDDDDDEDLDEMYLGRSSNINIRIGNRRWGNNGFVRAGKQEARPVHQQPHFQDSGAGPSREPKKKEASARDVAAVGRRAKRTLKREAANKAATAKHQQHLVRLGRN